MFLLHCRKQTLCSYDQFSNMILQDAFERRIVVVSDGSTYYTDIPVGMYVVRGDSMVLSGALNEHMQQHHMIMKEVSLEELDKLQPSGKDALEWDFDSDLIA
jgi:U6 snRNA-associated Sm-like protein LSm1